MHSLAKVGAGGHDLQVCCDWHMELQAGPRFHILRVHFVQSALVTMGKAFRMIDESKLNFVYDFGLVVINFIWHSC